MAFQIIRHAFRMIYDNLGQALRVSVGPYLILVIASVVAITLADLPTAFVVDPSAGVPVGLSPLVFLAIIALLVFGLFVFGWVAVSWHRFILLEEYAGALPAVAGRPIWPYVGRMMLYGFFVVIAAIPIFFVFGLVAAPFASGPNDSQPVIVVGFFVFLASALLTFIWFRIALALPGVAVGKPISIGEAWSATSSMAGTIFGVAFLLMGINGIAGLVVGQVSALLPIIGFVLNILVQWVTLMLGVSILTTFYGHLIEKRPLVD